MKFTVIIPVYKTEEYLRKCIDSVINQTYKNIEILIINDGSPDNSEKIIKSYKDERIRYIYKENSGLGAVRNIGFKEAAGDYICAVDSDDWLAPNFIEEFYKTVKKTNCDIAICDFYKIENDNKKYINVFIDDIKDIRVNYIFSSTAVQLRCIKKEFYKKHNLKFKEGIIYEDLAVMPYLAVLTDKIVHVKKPLYNYLVRDESITHPTAFQPKLNDIFAAFEHLSSLFKNKYKEEIEFLYIKRMLFSAHYRVINFDLEITKDYHKKINDTIKKKFPNWRKNKYLKYLPEREMVGIEYYYNEEYDKAKRYLLATINSTEKKKILLATNSFLFGGIEKALNNLLLNLDYNLYDVTVLAHSKEGELLADFPEEVKLEIIKLSKFKFINTIKQKLMIKKYKNKFDFAGCFVTWEPFFTKTIKEICPNNAVWIHTNYKMYYKNIKEKIEQFFYARELNKYSKIVFVSDESKKDTVRVLKDIKDKSLTINNLINCEEIDKKSTDECDLDLSKRNLIFIGRTEEKSKKISRIIELAETLTDDYKIFIVGGGFDFEEYEKEVKNRNLENKVILLGAQMNPYKYLKKCDCLLLTSDYEGFPVVILEALNLNKKIVTTIDINTPDLKLSDYALIAKKEVSEIKSAVLEVFKRDFPEFDIKKYNETNLEKLMGLFNEENY